MSKPGRTRSAATHRLVFTRDAARKLDRLAVEEFGIPSIVLMENAAVHLAAAAQSLIPSRNANVVVYCGPGNNGGDGFAMARHLHNGGVAVSIVLAVAPERYSGDAALNLGIIRAMKLPVLRRPPTAAADLIVDALLGTGLTSPVREPIAGLIRRVNRARSPVLAVDIPSGLDADSGTPLGIAVRADVTVTMAGHKTGFAHPGAKKYVGRVVVADIGVPRVLAARLSAKG